MHVMHDSPQNFTRQGAVIKECPCCAENLEYQKENFTEEENAKERERLEAVEMVCDLLGEDIDGACSMLEDFGLV
jgi:hypothetical protein